MNKVREFFLFISRSNFVQDAAFGTKRLKLNSGITLPIYTSSFEKHDNNQNHAFVPGRLQTGRERAPERTHLFSDYGSLQCFKTIVPPRSG